MKFSAVTAGAILALLASPSFATGPESRPHAEQEIDALLSWVGDSGCLFIRNDSEHSAEEAEQHLRSKYKRGRKYAATPELFIDRLASRSSWSAEPYRVQCSGADGTAIESLSSAWLQSGLRKIRSKDF